MGSQLLILAAIFQLGDGLQALSVAYLEVLMMLVFQVYSFLSPIG